MPITLTPSTPAGRYATLADWDNFAGSLNVLAYSDKDGAGVLNAAGIQAAMDYADDRLHSLLYNYVRPLSFKAVPENPNGVVLPRVRYAATVIGIFRYEYFGRAIASTDETGKLLKAMVKEIEDEVRAWNSIPGRLPCVSAVSFGVSNANVGAARRNGAGCGVWGGGWYG